MREDAVTRWVERYRRAWISNDPGDIRSLFTEHAEYTSTPGTEPYRGHEEIVSWWLENADGPDETTFTWEPLLVGDTRAVIEGRTVYLGATAYRNLWVIDLAPDGRATAFTEWWVEEEDVDLDEEDGPGDLGDEDLGDESDDDDEYDEDDLDDRDDLDEDEGEDEDDEYDDWDDDEEEESETEADDDVDDVDDLDDDYDYDDDVDVDVDGEDAPDLPPAR
ncbi:nuclear transport factor 2 family protein [Agromyces sp. SYSU T00194]|uniref:nuclear transport factor 2 family protein n=1 Tax=Agromyces chitinivorans TaxID=3158560 RepID=UPI003392DB91